VRVICRFRPANDRERRENVAAKEGEGLSLEVMDSHTVQVVGPGSKEVLNFNFDHVFGENAAQRQVYEITARDTVKDMLDGYNGTIFAYGQTGAGKTYTMTSNLTTLNIVGGGGGGGGVGGAGIGGLGAGGGGGGGGGNIESRGIVPRACSQLFAHIEQDASGTEYTIKCSFLEIYKEGLRDLLANNIQQQHHQQQQITQKLKIRETPAKGVWVEGLTEAFVTCESEIFALLQLGEQSRSVASTNMNAVSSRSHTLFVITLVQKLKDGSTKMSRLNLADLAGSEKVGKTGATGDTLEEAKKINQSLSALGNCIVALTKSPEKRKHVPYRDSKLTFILRESLGGNSKTTLLIACSPHLYNLEETISTLRFGQRAKSIKNQVKINAHRSVTELELIITKLQSEVSRLRAYSKTLEQELITRLPGETIDLQSIQEKAWKSMQSNGETSNSSSAASNQRGTTSFMSNRNNLSVPNATFQSSTSTSTANTTRSKRALSGSHDSPLLSKNAVIGGIVNNSSNINNGNGGLVGRPRSDSDQSLNLDSSSSSSSHSHSHSPSSSLSFLSSQQHSGQNDGISDGTRSPPSEDSDFWAPMNLVEAQLAYDKMKEEMEFKLQDALDELAQAKDENGIEQHKTKLTQEFLDYKASNDNKLLEVQALSSEMMSKIAFASEQAESLAEQLNLLSDERDSLLQSNQTLSLELNTFKSSSEQSISTMSKKSEEEIAKLESSNKRLEMLLQEQMDSTRTKSQQLDDASAMISKLTADLNEARETKTLLKTQISANSLEIESLRTSLQQKETQLSESTLAASALEIRLQEYMGRVEEQGKASGEGLKMLGNLNKTLTEKNQQLFEEKNGLVSRQSELQLKLDIAQNELETLKTSRAADQVRISAVELELNVMRTELEQSKMTAMKRAQVLELEVKDLEKNVLEEQRTTLQAQLQMERARVETEVAHTETVRIKADLERELALLGVKVEEERKVRESALLEKTRLCDLQSSEIKALREQVTSLNVEVHKMEVNTKIGEEMSVKRIEALEEDLTDARVTLRRTKEEMDVLREEKTSLRMELTTLMNAKETMASTTMIATPVKPNPPSIIGRDPTTNPSMMMTHGGGIGSVGGSINSRIAVPVSSSLSGGGIGAAGLLSSRTSAPSTSGRPTKAAASILNTPSMFGDTQELTGWFQVCSAVGKTSHSSGWKRLWVVAKERKVTCYENQDMRNIVEALQVRGCHLLQLPNTSMTLIEQPTEHCFVLISNHDDANIDSQDEYAFCAQSPDMLNAFVQYFLKVDCDPLAFSQLRLESILPLPTITSPTTQKSAFSRLAQPSSSSTTSSAPPTTPARSFLSGLFGTK
jgi:hypothetical protein